MRSSTLIALLLVCAASASARAQEGLPSPPPPYDVEPAKPLSPAGAGATTVGSDTRPAAGQQAAGQQAAGQQVADINRPRLDHALTLSGLWYGRELGTGLGARLAYQKAVLWPAALGLADSLQDGLSLEVDLSFNAQRWRQYARDFAQNRWSLNLSGLWNVWLLQDLAMYAKLGVGYRFGAIEPNNNFYPDDALQGLQGTIAVGALYRIADFAIRLEFSNRAHSLGLLYALPL